MRREAGRASDVAPPPGAVPAPGGDGLGEEQAREGAMEGALLACGELGYREASVRAILDRSGGHRAQFYDHFASKEDCFAQAYSVWIDRLGIELLQAAVAAPGWEAGVRAGIAWLFRFAIERPAIAQALFVEVQIAGEPATAKREAALERLAAAVDSARNDLAPEQEPPDATASFVVGGVESCVAEALTAGDPARLWDALPELMHFAVGSYFGKAEAEAAFERASELLARDRAALTGASE
ncbi:MAG: TetR/AcrR family transcriptional regulator [Thermoleophilaceae bacterium]